MMLRFFRIAVVVVFVWLVMMPPAFSAEQPGEISNQLTDLDLKEIDFLISQLDQEVKSAMPGLNFRDMLGKISSGEMDISFSSILKNLAAYLMREIVAGTSLLGKVVVLAVMCAVLQNLSNAFEKNTVGQLAHTVVYLAIVGLAMGSFAMAMQVGREVIEDMVGFMQAVLPVMLTLLVAVGGVAAAAIFHPILLTGIAVIGTLFKDVALPLLFFSAILGMVGNLSPRFKVSNLAGLFKSVGMGVMGLLGTVFLGLLAVQGVAGSVSNGIALRTAKYATDAFVPVVGGVFSDALEAIISSSLLIKNAVGFGSMIVILLILVFPLLKILALVLIYRLAGALAQPVGDERIAGCLNEMGGSLMTVFAIVAMVGLLFFFTFTIVLGAGNLTVMLR